jgi:hypothetical protein
MVNLFVEDLVKNEEMNMFDCFYRLVSYSKYRKMKGVYQK